MLKLPCLGRKSKLLVAGGFAAVLLLFGFVAWAGGRAAQFVKEQAAAQEFLAGTLSVGDVGASVNGDVWLSDIAWHDPAGVLVAKIPRLSVSVRLRDILNSGLSAGSIQTIMLERPQLRLSYDEKTGLNILRLVKAEKKDAEKKDARVGSKAPDFRGTIEIAKGLLEITSGQSRLRYENLDGKLSYAAFPQVAGSMQAKQNKADFAGQVAVDYSEAGREKLNITVEGRSLSIADFFQMVPVKSNVKVLDGAITNLRAEVSARGQEEFSLRVKGGFANLAGEAEGISLSEFKGDFNGNSEEISFNEVSGRLNGQAVNMNGKVALKREPYPVDLRISSAAFKLAALSPELAADASPLAFDATISGNLEAPLARGSFSIASFKTDQLSLVNGKGNFRYSNGIVYISGASAGMYGGAVGATGQVRLSDKGFAFDLKGSGINSAELTETPVSGPLSFTAHASGAGDPKTASAKGAFVIGRGNINGIPFNSLTGDFSKRGEETDFSNVKLHTAAGTARLDATVSSGGRVRFGKIDLETLKRGDQSKNAADKLRDTLKKLF